MGATRLVEALNSLDPSEIDRVFGNEADLLPSADEVELAPVKRVAIMTEAFFPKVDGVAKSAYLTLRYLQKTGREVIVFAPDIAPARVGPSRVIPMPSVGLPFAPETRVALPTPSVARHLEAFQPDLIHLFSPVMMAASGMIIGRRRYIPVVANYQTDLPAYTEHYGFNFLSSPVQNWLRYVHNSSHLTLVPSNYTLHQLRRQEYKRLRIWGRGVDLGRFNPKHRSEEFRKRLLDGRDPDSLLVLYVGRLATEKRIDLLLDVAKLPGVALTLVGDGAMRDELERMFAGTNTVFTGYMYGEDLAKAYASADVFVFPGPSETFGQVVQEAMAAGLPAVIVNRGGIVDLVTDGVNGFVCPENPHAFAEAVQRLRDDPALRRRMAQNARRQAERRPWTAIMAQLEQYYKEAIELNRRWTEVSPPPRFPRLHIARPLNL